MPEPTWSAEELAQSALADLTIAARAALAVETLTQLGGTDGLHLLSVARAAISERMQELITQEVLEGDLPHDDVIQMPRMRPVQVSS